ncbi:F-box domain containing protein [Pandoravirus salinus]|uniref:F-box domain containing protein n=1 Tax=Pandoravirus salinus TaxID=1349410 RepID=S4W5A2_9VIRU|nr:F-box domain [Pandoravirus salinus]AGO85510.1 F-box domain containing protein [Pandoravirus salinus]
MEANPDALPDEVLDAILNGADSGGRSRLDAVWRFAARAVCRHWRAIVDRASRADMRRIRREVPRALPRPNTVVHASAVAALVRRCAADGISRADADRAVTNLWSWASTLRCACDSEIAAAMLAASTRASVTAALAACVPTDADGDGTRAVYPGGTLLRVAATYCTDARDVAALVNVCAARLTTEVMAACAGAGRCDTVAFMLLRAARSGDRQVLRSMARTAWLRAAWRDASGRTAALLARMTLAPKTDGSSTLPERAGDYCVLAADGRPASREAAEVCAAVRHTADDQTPWWWFTARWGNIRAFAACADRGVPYLPERALVAAAGAGRAGMCAWLVARDARALGIVDDCLASDARRRQLASVLAVAASAHGARCAPVFDWLRASLGFMPDVSDAAAILDAALGVTPRAITLLGPLPHAIIYALDAWPSIMVSAVKAAPQCVWDTARDRLARAVDMGHWNAADILVAVLDRAARVRGDVAGPVCDVWAPTVAAMASAAASAPDGLCRVGDLRRACALALRCVDAGDAAGPIHSDLFEDRGVWHHAALVDPSWSRAGDRVAWRRCCRPTPVPRALLLGPRDAATSALASPLAGLLVRWLDAVGLVDDREPAP